MRNLFYLGFILLCGCSSTKNPVPDQQKEKIQIQSRIQQRCSKNSDSQFDRDMILKRFSSALNKSVSTYIDDPLRHGFYSKEGRPTFFFVHDFVDTLNHSYSHEKCIDFIENHVYHFAASSYKFSLSNIAVLEKGGIKIFEAINCPGGNKIEDIQAYIQNMSIDSTTKQTILNRIINYRKYSKFIATDPQAVVLRCKTN